jgi:hypothetical protein
MNWNVLLLGSLLIGQVPRLTAAAADSPTTAVAPRSAQAMTPEKAVPPPAMMAEALTTRTGSTIAGRPLTLAAALSMAAQRSQQLEAIRAYWRLVEMQTDYHFALDFVKRLEQLSAGQEEEPLLRAGRASAVAELREAEVAVLSAQHDLAVAAGLPAGDPLPLPADRPHTGPYRTNFQALFADRPAPPRAWLMERTLPVRRRTIDARAAAVAAAQEAAAATIQAYAAHRVAISAALTGVDELRRQQRAFVASVCRYNDDIADYALGVAPPDINGPTLVGMLIETAREPIRPTLYTESPGAAGRLNVAVPGTTGKPGDSGMAPVGSEPGVVPALVQPPPTAVPNWSTPAHVPGQPTRAPPETRPRQAPNSDKEKP